MKGYSLIEILIILALLSILVTIGGSSYLSARSKYKLQDATLKLKSTFVQHRDKCMTGKMFAEVTEDKGFKFKLKGFNGKVFETYIANDENYIYTSDFDTFTYLDVEIKAFPKNAYFSPEGMLNIFGAFGIRVIGLNSGKDNMIVIFSTGLISALRFDKETNKWVKM